MYSFVEVDYNTLLLAVQDMAETNMLANCVAQTGPETGPGRLVGEAACWGGTQT
jgi:hypothetical protein